jgi:hypothetical protein
MSAPEVRDITFDRPDYTAGAFIVFTGQTSEVAPPGEFWTRRGYQKILTASAPVSPGTFLLLIYYPVGAGRTLFVTDIMLEMTGSTAGGEPRYPSTGYWYSPRVPNMYAEIDIFKSGELIDVIEATPYSTVVHKNYRTPLTYYSGEVLEVRGRADIGTTGVFVMVTGYETTG